MRRAFVLGITVITLALVLQTVAGKARAEDATTPNPVAAPGAGLWEGTLDVGLVKLRLVLHLNRDDKGVWTATMDSVDQGAADLPVDSVTWDGDKVTCELKQILGAFYGKLDAESQQFIGEWKQAGRTWPLTLKKVDRVTPIERPQEPRPPFPYQSEEVTYAGLDEGVKLAGTLTLPEGEGPHPAVILISGSGQQDRDELVFGHRPFWVIADHLTRRGIAVLRVDDRGVGGSVGEVKAASSLDFANDVRAGIRFLQGRADIDRRRVGLIGHSEGGLIAPLVAADNNDVAFLVLLAAPGVTGEEILYRQEELIARAMGADAIAIAVQRATQERFISVVKEEHDAENAARRLRELANESLAALSEDDREQLGNTEQLVEQQSALLQSAWLRFFVTHDPRPTLAKVGCPVLALNGEKDLQVDPKQNLPELEKAFRNADNTRVKLVELPGLNHLFQTSSTGAISEYGQLTETFSPAALKLIGDWVGEQVNVPPR